MLKMQKKEYIIDAKDQVLGRLASRIALILRGKDDPNFSPHKDMNVTVLVKNVDKIKITGNKLQQKKYFRHTGYVGHLKEIPLKKIFQKDPQKVLKRVVWGMLPKNKLRKKIIKRLKFI